MNVTTLAVAEVCADWWADRLQIEDRRKLFRDALVRRLAIYGVEPKSDFGFGIQLKVDYDPDDTLLLALKDAAIECRGFMWSAEGILPLKTRMKIYPDGRVIVQEGRGAQDVELLTAADASA